MEVADTRPRRVAEAEFKRFTEGAALLIAATPPSDPCDDSWACARPQLTTRAARRRRGCHRE